MGHRRPYDVEEVIAHGFCGFHHHQVSGLTIGNDGWLYITSGDDDNYVEGSDGSRATVLRTGAVFRCRPDGSQDCTPYSIGYRNPYRDVAFDTAFNLFHADNDNEDGGKFMPAAGSCTSPRRRFRLAEFAGNACATVPIPCAPLSSANCPVRCRRCSRPAAALQPAC